MHACLSDPLKDLTNLGELNPYTKLILGLCVQRKW